MKNLFSLAALCVAAFTLSSCNQAEITKPAEAAATTPTKPDLAKVKAEIQALETAFQPVLVLWALWSTGAWAAWRKGE